MITKADHYFGRSVNLKEMSTENQVRRLVDRDAVRVAHESRFAVGNTLSEPRFDLALLYAYAEGTLTPEQGWYVAHNIKNYPTWNGEYMKMRAS